MASLIRPTVVRWVLPSGRHVPAGTPGARKRKGKAAKWYGANVPGHPGKKLPLSTDRKAAQRMLDDLVRRHEQGRAGLPGDEPLGPLLDEWAQTIGGGETHVREVVNHAASVLRALQLRTLLDLRARGLSARVEAHVRGLCEGEGAVSGRTAAAYGLHVRQFTRWVWRKKELLDTDPLAGLDLPSQQPENPRADLSPDELAKLIDAARTSERTVKKLTGPARACLYLTAAATGFRAGELAGLTKADLHLETDPPTVRLDKRHQYDGKTVQQPIPPAVASVLKAHTARLSRQARVWPSLWYLKAAAMLRVDLASAGLTARTERGTRDFHSLRHSYASMLAVVASASVMRELARHGDVSTTLKHYVHASGAAKTAAVNALPLPGHVPGAGKMVLTREQVENLAAAGWVVLATLLGGDRR